MAKTQDFFSDAEKDAIVKAIQAAEKNTSGEIRVHLDKGSRKPAFERAKEVFVQLRMDETELANGVLIYLDIEQHQFAIIGDKGINDLVPENFWEKVRDTMQQGFKAGKFAEGLTEGIQLAGEQLQAYFPYMDGDKNELPDDISHGN